MFNRVRQAADNSSWFNQADWLNKIDNYEIEHPRAAVEGSAGLRLDAAESAAAVHQVLDTKAYQLLHKQKESEKSKTLDVRHHRKKFIEYLSTLTLPQDESDPPKLIDMDSLLGKQGVALYKDAIKEEKNSEAFRNATFLKSMKHIQGNKWSERLVLWIGGPSGAGKSFGADAILKELDEKGIKKHDQDRSGNDVIFIDGGIERTISQMRQAVLQAALIKGYGGIRDLEKNTKLKTKKYINKAATSQGLNLIIPSTFRKDSDFNAIENFASQPQTRQIFSMIVSPLKKENQDRFQRTIEIQGNMRAWMMNKNKTFQQAMPNNIYIGCESKKYESSGFKFGIYNSWRAKKAYFKHQKNKPIYVELTNDSLFLIHDSKQQKWIECIDPKNIAPKVRISADCFKVYEALLPAEKNQLTEKTALEAWIKNHEKKHGKVKIKIEGLVAQPKSPTPAETLNWQMEDRLPEGLTKNHAHANLSDEQTQSLIQRLLGPEPQSVGGFNTVSIIKNPSETTAALKERNFFVLSIDLSTALEAGQNAVSERKVTNLVAVTTDNKTDLFASRSGLKILTANSEKLLDAVSAHIENYLNKYAGAAESRCLVFNKKPGATDEFLTMMHCYCESKGIDFKIRDATNPGYVFNSKSLLAEQYKTLIAERAPVELGDFSLSRRSVP